MTTFLRECLEELHECFSVDSVVVDGDIDDDTYSIDFK